MQSRLSLSVSLSLDLDLDTLFLRWNFNFLSGAANPLSESSQQFRSSLLEESPPVALNPSMSSANLPLSFSQSYDLSVSRKSTLFQSRYYDSVSSNILDRPPRGTTGAGGSQHPRLTLMSVLEQSQNRERRSSLTVRPSNAIGGGPRPTTTGPQGQLLSPLSLHSLPEDDQHLI
jgi:hypothetical protein